MAQNNLKIGDTVMLKHPNYSSHRWFEWENGIIKDFSEDKTECKIMSTVRGEEKTFVEFVDNLKPA